MLTEMTKRKPGRPKLPIEKRMEFLSVQIPPEIRRRLDVLSIHRDKSISQIAREALNLIVFLYEKEAANEHVSQN